MYYKIFINHICDYIYYPDIRRCQAFDINSKTLVYDKPCKNYSNNYHKYCKAHYIIFREFCSKYHLVNSKFDGIIDSSLLASIEYNLRTLFIQRFNIKMDSGHQTWMYHLNKLIYEDKYEYENEYEKEDEYYKNFALHEISYSDVDYDLLKCLDQYDLQINPIFCVNMYNFNQESQISKISKYNINLNYFLNYRIYDKCSEWLDIEDKK